MMKTPQTSLRFWETCTVWEKLVILAALRYAVALGTLLVLGYTWYQEHKYKELVNLPAGFQFTWVTTTFEKPELLLAIIIGVLFYNTCGAFLVRHFSMNPIAITLSFMDIVTAVGGAAGLLPSNQASTFSRLFVTVLLGNVLFLGIPTLAVLYGRKASLFAIAFFFLAQAGLLFFAPGINAQIPTMLAFVQMFFFTILSYLVGYISEVEQTHYKNAKNLGLLEKALRLDKEILVEDLQKANEIKTQFLAFASHELRTPLQSVIGYANCLLDGLDGPITPEQTRDVQRISSNADYLLHLINDFLDLTKIEAGKFELTMEEFSIDTCLEEVADAIRPLCREKGIGITLDVEERLPLVETDYSRIKQVLLNLTGNAMKFTEKGGITISASLKDDHLSLNVSDTGVGIPPEILPHIFEEYRQWTLPGSRRYGSTGLGLTITKKLVRLLGGEITAESRQTDASGQAGGTSITILLPVRASTAA